MNPLMQSLILGYLTIKSYMSVCPQLVTKCDRQTPSEAMGAESIR